MDRFPDKISVGIFLTAFVPDTLHKPSYVLEEHIERCGNRRTEDTEVSLSSGGKTLMLPGPNTLSNRFYQLCSKEDLELAKSLVRRGSLFVEELWKRENLREEAYGCVPSAYIVCNEDLALKAEFQKWMIQNAGIGEMQEIKGADHMAMLSKPHELCSSLLHIAHNHT